MIFYVKIYYTNPTEQLSSYNKMSTVQNLPIECVECGFWVRLYHKVLDPMEGLPSGATQKRPSCHCPLGRGPAGRLEHRAIHYHFIILSQFRSSSSVNGNCAIFDNGFYSRKSKRDLDALLNSDWYKKICVVLASF